MSEKQPAGVVERLRAHLAKRKKHCGWCRGKGFVWQNYDDYGMADPKELPCSLCGETDALLSVLVSRAAQGETPPQEPEVSACRKRAGEAEQLAALLFQRYVDHPESCGGRTIPRNFDDARCTCGLRELAQANQSIVALAFLLSAKSAPAEPPSQEPEDAGLPGTTGPKSCGEGAPVAAFSELIRYLDSQFGLALRPEHGRAIRAILAAPAEPPSPEEEAARTCLCGGCGCVGPHMLRPGYVCAIQRPLLDQVQTLREENERRNYVAEKNARIEADLRKQIDEQFAEVTALRERVARLEKEKENE